MSTEQQEQRLDFLETDLPELILSDDPHMAIGAILVAEYLYGEGSSTPSPNITKSVREAAYTTPTLTSEYASRYSSSKHADAGTLRHILGNSLLTIIRNIGTPRDKLQAKAIEKLAK